MDYYYYIGKMHNPLHGSKQSNMLYTQCNGNESEQHYDANRPQKENAFREKRDEASPQVPCFLLTCLKFCKAANLNVHVVHSTSKGISLKTHAQDTLPERIKSETLKADARTKMGKRTRALSSKGKGREDKTASPKRRFFSIPGGKEKHGRGSSLTKRSHPSHGLLSSPGQSSLKFLSPLSE